MRVLGVDPGLTRCGLGVVDGLPGGRHGRGRRRARPSLGTSTSGCVDSSAQIEEWLEEHAPDAVAVERVFAQHNLRTVMGTAQVAGIAMVAAARRRIPVALHTPSEVKAAVTGNGRADKAQVQTMVHRGCCGSTSAPSPADAADALALADLPPVAARGCARCTAARARLPDAAQRAWAAAEQAPAPRLTACFVHLFVACARCPAAEVPSTVEGGR